MRIMVNLLAQRSWPTGTARYALNLIRALADSNPGDEEYLALVTLENRGFFRPLADCCRLLPVRVPSSRPSLRVLYEQLVLPGLARRLGIDLLFTPYVAIPLRAPCPAVTAIHDVIGLDHPYRGGLAHRVYLRVILRLAAGRSAAVVTVSKASASAIAHRLGVDPRRVFITPNAVDPRLHDPDDPDRAEADGGDGPFFLYVGNAEPGKNIELLLRAMLGFRESQATGFALRLVGPRGAELGLLTKRVRALALTGAVEPLGPVSDPELARLYRQALALVSPSREEGFGLPCLEAMALGCPVLCSDIPVFRELYDGAAAFFDPDDADGLAALMEKVAADEAMRRELIAAGLERAGGFSWEDAARGAREAFHYALEGPAGGGAS